MMKKTIKIKLAGVILGISLAGLPGCTPTAGFLNPFQYVTNIVSVDNTPFFIELYTALIQSGQAVTGTTDTDTGTGTDTPTTDPTLMDPTTQFPGF